MSMRQLGRSGIMVPTICLGGNVFGWTVDEGRSFEVLDAAVGAGLNFIDTADVYSKWVPGHVGGESEVIIGKWMKARGNRAGVILATKCGMELTAEKKGLSKRHILAAIDESLVRLQTDYVDLYQAHKDDPTVPLEETLDAFTQVVKAGKARAIGASNYEAVRLEQALKLSERHGLVRFECLQPHYNMYERAGFEKELAGLCQREEVGVIPYFALASGFLTGKYRSEADFGKSKRGGGMKKYLNERGMRILGALDAVGARVGGVGATPARVALAWLMAMPGVTAPIASATSVEQVGELAAARGLVLDGGAMRELTEASGG